MTKTLIWLIFILVAFGLVMISSAGVYLSQRNFGTSYYYFSHQLLFGLVPGLFLFFAVSKIDYRFWKKFAPLLLILSLALMILVFVPGLGLTIRGARRWVDLGFISFQPSEILKLAMIIYLASWFSSKVKKSGSEASATIAFLIILFFIGVLLSAQPDIGTLGIIALIALAMFFVSEGRFKHLLGIILLLALFFSLLIGFSSYRANRFLVFLNPDFDSSGSGYHLNQSLIALGKGGFLGVGFGKGEQKLGFLPEPAGDSIFAVIGEELGFVGMVFTIFLLVSLVTISIIIAKKTKDQFASLYAVGFASWVGFQSFINIASLSGLIPLTGIPLPFISFGGTSLASLLAASGVLVNISKKA